MRKFETEKINSARKYFSALAGNADIAKVLRAGSISEDDFNHRMDVYRKAYANVDAVRGLNDSIRKMFANVGAGASDLEGTTQFDASILANVKSFAGYLAIERALSQPNDYVSFLDVVGAYTDNEVEPNLGETDYSGVVNALQATGVATADTAVVPTNSTKIIPKSVTIEFKEAAASYTITDDGKGGLLAPAGKLKAGSVNYATGAITFTPAVAGTWTLSAALDQIANSQLTDDTILTFKQAGTLMRTAPQMVMSQVNLATAAAMGKSLGVDPLAYMANQLQIAYIQMLNRKLAKGTMEVAAGNTAFSAIDFSTQAYDSYVSYADWFTAQFTDVDYSLAEQSYKGVKATAYLVAPNVAALMTKTEIRGNFKRSEEYGYINDLVGYFRGVPVLQHVDIPTGSGYAVFKKEGGEAAPLVRGIYLPITETPAVGNYNNTTQVANGIYYQEGVKGIFPQLVKKFTVEGTMGN